ncbi:MAG: DUF2490 domain-containing protein [Saprospiraceae bacterium]|nr:DUF2490 domain-containing protein [Candidatus Opimibacter skivensis]
MKILYALLLLLPFQAAAQESETGNWMMYFGNQKLSDRWNWHNEIQYRNYNFAGDLEQLLFRTGIGYNLSANNNNLLLGYAYIHGEPYVAGTDEKTNVNEHRIFQQFISRQQFGRFYLQHRYRIEERFIEGDFKMRFRYFLGLNVPINKKEMVSKAIYLSLYNEIFIQPKSPVFDRDRVYGAIGYVFSSNLKVEAGMMAQLLESSDRAQFQIALFNTFPLMKS